MKSSVVLVVLVQSATCWFFGSSTPDPIYVDFTAALPEAEEQAERSYEENDVLGVEISQQSKFKMLKCQTGPNEEDVVFLGQDKINDNICDCGIDEPGTNACSILSKSQQKFYCPNVGYKSVYLSKSKVGDGICDCCDGSDELKLMLDPLTKHHHIDFENPRCPNKCSTLGKAYIEKKNQEELNKKIGATKKLEYVQKGVQLRKEAQEKLEIAQEDLNSLKTQLQDLEDELIEMKSRENAPKDDADKPAPVDEAKLTAKRIEALQLEKLSTKDLHKLVVKLASRTKSGYQLEELVNSLAGDVKEDEEDLEPPYWIESSFDEDQYDDYYEDQAYLEDETKALEKEKRTVKSKVSKLEKEISGYKGDLSADDITLGSKDICTEKHLTQYKYSVCLMKEAKQARTLLGKFSHVTETDDVKTMHFTEGQKCFNGVKRSLTLTLVCGHEEELLWIKEPSMCQYEGEMRSPIGC